jgi:hypothetical protein
MNGTVSQCCNKVVYKSSIIFSIQNDTSALGEVDFWIFWIFNFLQFAIDGKTNYKTKVEKVFFFIFMSSYEEMSFLKPKIIK